MSRRKATMLVVVSVLLLLSMSVVVSAQLQCPEEVDRMLKNRMPRLGDQVLEFYDSWSIRELEAGKQPGKGFTVAVGCGSQGNDPNLFGFWGTIRRLELMGCKVIYMAGPGNQSPECAVIIENFVARKPDAIIFLGSNAHVLGPGLDKAEQRGVPVFGFDNWLSGYSVAGEVMSDNFDIGRKATNYVINELGGRGNVAVVFSPGHRGTEARAKQWELMIKEYPEVKEIARIPWTPPNYIGSVRDRTEAVLLANPKPGSLNGVLATVDVCGFGAADAIEAAGRQDEIFVIGIDGDREAMRRIAAGGAIKATISQDHTLMSAAVAHLVVDYLNKKPTPRFVYAPTTLVTRDNVHEVFKEKFGEELER
jgi:ribose transport system substrate-binding protein